MGDRAVQSLTFEQWVEYVFDRPTSPFNDWYWQIDDDGNDANWWAPDKHVVLEYLTRLFKNAGFLAQKYTRDQIAQAVWFIFGAGSNYLWVTMDGNLDLRARIELIHSIGTLYETLFAQLCGYDMQSLNESGRYELDVAVYMIWDMDSLGFSPTDQIRKPIDDAQFAVLERILEIDNVVCRESALHGLGHASLEYPDRSADIIDQFLSRHTDIRPELKQYAQDARVGGIQ